MTKRILTVMLALGAGPAFANYKLVEGDRATDKMKSGEAYYSYEYFKFEDWAEGANKNALNLFPGFRKGYDKDKVEMFIAKTSFIIERPASEVSIAAFADQAKLQGLQTKLAGLSPLLPGDVQVVKDPNLAYRARPDQPWCEGANTCLTSNFTIDIYTRAAIAFYMLKKGRSDSGTIWGQSEVRVLDAGQAASLSVLADPKSAPTGAVVENFFYFNHGLEFAKILGLVQPFPGDANKSIVHAYAAFAVERKHWDDKSIFNMEDVFLSKAHNTTVGLGRGFPTTTKELLLNLADFLSTER